MSPQTRLPGLAVVAASAALAVVPAASASSSRTAADAASTTPAAKAKATPTTAAKPKAAAKNCVGGPTGATRCFGTFRAAIAHATHGTVKDAPKSARTAAKDRRLRAKLRGLTVAPKATGGRATTRAVGDGNGEIIAATLFDDQDYGGSSYTVTAGAPCKKDGLIEWQIDLPEDWQNRVSSVQPWGNCWIWLYPELGLSGDRDGPFDQNTPYVGAQLDNRTKSVGLS